MEETPKKNIPFILGVVAVGFAVLAAVVGYILYPGYMHRQKYEAGVARLQKGQLQDARVLFDAALSYRQDDPRSLYYLGKIALGKQSQTSGKGPIYPDADFQKAASHFETAFTYGLQAHDEAMYRTALNDAGFSYFMRKEYAKAQEKYLEYIRLSPDDAFIPRYFVALNDFERFNKPEEARDILLPAVGSASTPLHFATISNVYVLLARLQFYFGEYEEAQRNADLAIAKGAPLGNDLQIQIAHAVRASSLARKGDISGAENAIKKANELAGSDKAFACSLADAYVEGGLFAKALLVAHTVPAGKNYGYSICLHVLASASETLKKENDARMYMEQYLSLTDTFVEKNIVVERYRNEYRDALGR